MRSSNATLHWSLKRFGQVRIRSCLAESRHLTIHAPPAHKKLGKPRSIIADLVSVKINELNGQLQKSSLWSNIRFRYRFFNVY